MSLGRRSLQEESRGVGLYLPGTSNTDINQHFILLTNINQHFILSCLGSSQVGQEESSSGQFYHSVSSLSENQASVKENAENILVATILKINPPNYLIFSS